MYFRPDCSNCFIYYSKEKSSAHSGMAYVHERRTESYGIVLMNKFMDWMEDHVIHLTGEIGTNHCMKAISLSLNLSFFSDCVITYVPSLIPLNWRFVFDPCSASEQKTNFEQSKSRITSCSISKKKFVQS